MSSSENTLPFGADKTLAVALSVRVLARSGAIAGIIKLASAGLSFIMFVAVALVTDERQFGLYSATYAGASLISFFASVGQQSAVLRFWPQYTSLGDLPAAQGFMRRSLLVTLCGLLVTSLGIAAIGFLPGVSRNTPEWLPLCLSAALLSFGLGWSEFASGALRAKSALISALLPRDIVWRALIIAAVIGLHLMHTEISAVAATLLTAGLLFLSVAPQAFGLIRDTLKGARGRLSAAQRREFNQTTLGLWGVTSLPPALGQVSTLLVAGILGPEIAGAVFVADRTTRLVLLALTGINQALAPEISSAFHTGNKAHVQRIASLTALGSSIIAIGTLLVFCVFGYFILGIFDKAYATPTILLVLITYALGSTIATACGPVELLLQLTGSQNALLKILMTVNSIGLVITAGATYLFGPIGAAASIAATVAIWNIVAVIVARRRIGIDPSLLGLFR